LCSRRSPQRRRAVHLVASIVSERAAYSHVWQSARRHAVISRRRRKSPRSSCASCAVRANEVLDLPPADLTARPHHRARDRGVRGRRVTIHRIWRDPIYLNVAQRARSLRMIDASVRSLLVKPCRTDLRPPDSDSSTSASHVDTSAYGDIFRLNHSRRACQRGIGIVVVPHSARLTATRHGATT